MKWMALLASFSSSVTMMGCGVSPDYVSVNAATIHNNSESTLTTLDALKCEPTPGAVAGADPEQCAIGKAVLDTLKEEQREIHERAEALCTVAKSDCKPKPEVL